jgi:hypothetical protein
VPDKDRFTTADRVASHKPDSVCQVCLKVLEMDRNPPSKRHTDA